MSAPLTYGFVGLGHLGQPLALSLRRAGFALVVYDSDATRAKPVIDAGARAAANPRELAAQCDAVFTCLPSPQISESVLTGADGLLAGLRAGAAWIEMSTLGPDDVARLAALAAAGGVAMLESPVTGGVHKAIAGDITLLIGGDAALFEKHRSALQSMGGAMFHMGALGSAAVMKVITNMLAFVHLVAAGEALMLAKRGGLDLAQAFHAIKASSGTSFVHETESQVILNGSYNINFTMDLALKDLGFALAMGDKSGVPLDLASRTRQQFEKARAAYGGAAWSSMVVKLLEDACGTDLRAPGFPAEILE